MSIQLACCKHYFVAFIVFWQIGLDNVKVKAKTNANKNRTTDAKTRIQYEKKLLFFCCSSPN